MKQKLKAAAGWFFGGLWNLLRFLGRRQVEIWRDKDTDIFEWISTAFAGLLMFILLMPGNYFAGNPRTLYLAHAFPEWWLTTALGGLWFVGTLALNLNQDAVKILITRQWAVIYSVLQFRRDVLAVAAGIWGGMSVLSYPTADKYPFWLAHHVFLLHVSGSLYFYGLFCIGSIGCWVRMYSEGRRSAESFHHERLSLEVARMVSIRAEVETSFRTDVDAPFGQSFAGTRKVQ